MPAIIADMVKRSSEKNGNKNKNKNKNSNTKQPAQRGARIQFVKATMPQASPLLKRPQELRDMMYGELFASTKLVFVNQFSAPLLLRP